MIKEAKNIDFCTSGKELTEQDFERISEWIRKNKLKVTSTSKRRTLQKRTSPNIFAKTGLDKLSSTVVR